MSWEFKDMKSIDIKLSLLSGDNFKVGNLEIEPYTLREAKEYGYSRYLESLRWISLSIDDFIDSTNDEENRAFLEEQREDLRTFDFYAKLGGEDMRDAMLIALAMIFKTEDIRVLSTGAVAIKFEDLGIFTDIDGEMVADEEKLNNLKEDDLMLIHRDNFDEIIKIVKLQNRLEKLDEKDGFEPNPANEEARKLQEYMDMMNEKVRKIKENQRSEDGQEIDLADIISAVSSKSNSLNKLNIWDLTIYGLYDEYERLELIDNHDVSIKAMLAGADMKEEIKHWSSRI